MPRFVKVWRCASCGAPLPTGEFLDCARCDAMYWAAKDQALARQIERHDKFVPPEELPVRRVQLVQIARQLDRLETYAPPVRVAALDPDIVEAVVNRIDEITVPETPSGAKLIPITRGLWREEWPK